MTFRNVSRANTWSPRGSVPPTLSVLSPYLFSLSSLSVSQSLLPDPVLLRSLSDRAAKLLSSRQAGLSRIPPPPGSGPSTPGSALPAGATPGQEPPCALGTQDIHTAPDPDSAPQPCSSLRTAHTYFPMTANLSGFPDTDPGAHALPEGIPGWLLFLNAGVQPGSGLRGAGTSREKECGRRCA